MYIYVYVYLPVCSVNVCVCKLSDFTRKITRIKDLRFYINGVVIITVKLIENFRLIDSIFHFG